LSVVAPVVRIVRRRVMREDRSPSAGASREYHNEGAFRTASLLQPIAPHRSAQPMRQGPYGQRWPTQMAARRCPLASPSSQEVTICSSESSCWWPCRPPSSPAGQGPRVHLVPRLRHRSTRQPQAASRARCRASPPRRRDLTRHASRRRRVLPGTRRLAVRGSSVFMPLLRASPRPLSAGSMATATFGHVPDTGTQTPAVRVRCPQREGGF
jgi:hypothetical protein